MLRRNFTRINGESNSSRAYTQERRRFREVHPAVRFLVFEIVARNPMVTSQRSYTFFCPTITSARFVSITIENAGNQVIVTDVGEQ